MAIKRGNKYVYGKELILDLHDCNVMTFSRNSLRGYFKTLCHAIDMKRCKLVYWDDLHTHIETEKQTSPHTKGTSAVQFILTSNITIHTLDVLKAVYVNIHSCKDFNSDMARDITRCWFGGKVVQRLEVDRL